MWCLIENGFQLPYILFRIIITKEFIKIKRRVKKGAFFINRKKAQSIH